MVFVPLLAGCDNDDSSVGSTVSSSSTGSSLHVVATLDVKHAGVLVPTDDRLWVITLLTGTVTQVDPATNEVVQKVSLPHPAGYATVAHGSLWLVSFYYNALMEVDAESGKLLRTLERSPSLPLSYPMGIAGTGHDLWVLNHDNAKLLRVDARTGTVTHTTALAGHKAAGPHLVGGSLWIDMTREGFVHQVDPAKWSDRRRTYPGRHRPVLVGV
jgi:streptogramin lyase